MNKKTRQSGQALVAATFGLVALIGATGLAIDMGYLRYQKRLQQSAADSAALAGAAEINYGNVANAAKQDSSLNGFTDEGTLSGQTDPKYKISVTVNHPPSSGPNATNNNTVEVLVSAVQPLFFMKVFGLNPPTITARAVALAAGRNCVYGLTGIAGAPATINCGIINNANLITNGAVPAADPLAYLNPPAIGGDPDCTDGTVKGSKPPDPAPTKTLKAGIYCGISVTGNANVNLDDDGGTYIIMGPGGVTFSGTGTVTGNGVTFYLGPAAGPVSIDRAVNLVAPTTGPYAGILFYQDAGNTNAATITATGGSTLQGALYFPQAALNLNNTGGGAAYTIAVAQSLTLGGGTNFPADYSSLPGGSPIKDAVLVE